MCSLIYFYVVQWPENDQILDEKNVLVILSDIGSNVWSGNVEDDEKGRTSSANFRKENI